MVRRSVAVIFIASLFASSNVVAAAPSTNDDSPAVSSTGYAGIWPNATSDAGVTTIDQLSSASATFAGADSAAFDPVRVAEGYLAVNQPHLGLVADTEFTNPSATVADAGGFVVRFDQTLEHLPVFAGAAAVRIDDNGDLLSIATNAASGAPSNAADPAIGAVAAVEAATRAATEAFAASGFTPQSTTSSVPVRTIYDPHMIGGDPNAEKFDHPLLVWDITVTAPAEFLSQRILVDANTGAVVLSYSNQHDAINRDVCDVDNDNARTASTTCFRRRTEGGPALGIPDADDAYTQTGFFYSFFKDRFGRDGWDNGGAKFDMLTRACFSAASCPMANAAWIGEPFNLIMVGDGWVKDDVMFHEWTHAITDSTADLMYYAESGAINESISDVFGELMDLAYNPATGNGHDTPETAWLLGEDLSVGWLRSMSDPPAKNDPDKMTSEFYTPTSTSTRPANDSWGIHTNSGVSNKAAYLISEGGSFNGQTMVGIGQTKTATLYYELLTGVLTPGSDYLDLAYALPKACDNLVGLGKLAATDCDTVKAAVAATEMNMAAVQRRTATACPTGTPFQLFSADAEGPMTMAVGASNAETFRPSNRGSTQGDFSYWLPTPTGNTQKQESWMSTRYPVYISTQSPAFLTFSHSFSFQFDNLGRRPAIGAAGGVVEYSTNGTDWFDLASIADTVNGYSGTISDPTNPLNNRSAFVFESKGFEQVRIPLSSLAGQMAQFRWKFATNNAVRGDTGWLIDEISVHTCGDSAPTDTGFDHGRFTPVTPKRLFDTRSNDGVLIPVAITRRTPDSVLELDLTNLGVFNYGDQVRAVALNVTATNADRSGYVAVYPCDAVSETSTVNIAPGFASANSAIIPLAADGKVCFKTSLNVDVLADITGYFSTTRQEASTYRPINPKRIFDTRNNSVSVMTVNLGKRNDGDVITVPIRSMALYQPGETPVSVAVNVTTTEAENRRHVTAYPCAAGVPNTSTVNTIVNAAVTNSAIIPVDANGDICIRTAGRTHLVLDITGYFTAGGAAYRFEPVRPARVIDTRAGFPSANPGVTGQRSANSTMTVPFGGLGVYGSRTPVAVATNYTTVNAAAGGHLASWPCGTAQPETSVNNYQANVGARAASALAQLNAAGEACVFTNRKVDILADITGYFY